MNTFIYVNGLPNDISEEELTEFFKKCGAIMIDPYSGRLKIKIYTDENGTPKGDARICYSNIESVQMSIELLNSSEIRAGYTVNIQEATFQMKGEVYRPREIGQKLDKVEKMRIKAEVDK